MRREPRRFILAVHGGGEWEPDRHVVRHVDCAVVIEGGRTGFNRLKVVRLKREGRIGDLNKAGRLGSIAGEDGGTVSGLVAVGH